jgi:hypothetical protein
MRDTNVWLLRYGDVSGVSGRRKSVRGMKNVMKGLVRKMTETPISKSECEKISETYNFEELVNKCAEQEDEIKRLKKLNDEQRHILQKYFEMVDKINELIANATIRKKCGNRGCNYNKSDICLVGYDKTFCFNSEYLYDD